MDIYDLCMIMIIGFGVAFTIVGLFLVKQDCMKPEVEYNYKDHYYTK